MMKINENELKEIFNNIKINDKTAFEKLYDKYNKLVYGIAFSILKNKEDSEDIVQTVFTKIYNIDKSKLPADKEACWLYTVTKNESITLLRKKNNNLDIDSIYEVQEMNNELDEVVSKDVYNRLVNKLSQKDKEIVSLKILSDMSFSEIADLLNEPISTIKWRYYKSIKSLKLILSNVAMFIITFIIGIKTFFKKDIYTNQDAIKDDAFSDSTDNKSENKFESAVQDNTIIGDEFDQNHTISGTEQGINENYIEIGIFSVSVVILTISIIFSIFYTKHKCRRKK